MSLLEELYMEKGGAFPPHTDASAGASWKGPVEAESGGKQERDRWRLELKAATARSKKE
jgi:hypothetical protein